MPGEVGRCEGRARVRRAAGFSHPSRTPVGRWGCRTGERVLLMRAALQLLAGMALGRCRVLVLLPLPVPCAAPSGAPAGALSGCSSLLHLRTTSGPEEEGPGLVSSASIGAVAMNKTETAPLLPQTATLPAGDTHGAAAGANAHRPPRPAAWLAACAAFGVRNSTGGPSAFSPASGSVSAVAWPRRCERRCPRPAANGPARERYLRLL